MAFQSILFEKTNNDTVRETREEPAFFADLNLNQIVEALTLRKADYDLKPFFYTPVRDVETIHYRHQVMRDMQQADLMAHIKAFAEKMVVLRRYLALLEKLRYEYHIQGWFLEAALVYCDAVTGLARDLDDSQLQSGGLTAFRAYLADYVGSPAFRALSAEAREVKSQLAGVTYSVIIKNDTVKVRRYEGEPDYSDAVLNTFAKFQVGAAKDYRLDLRHASGMNHIEAQILDLAARLYPEPFAALSRFCANHAGFVDETIRAFDREIQFYVAFWDLVASLRHKGLSFCYPQVSAASREVYAQDAYDLALANAVCFLPTPIVGNDFELSGPERVLVISGPNQGGKTTFARMFGQLHYLASLGCPVPGREAKLFLFDRIVTHFEREEEIRNLRGKLQDDLVRIHDILCHATPNSILILNEIFASTTLQDAVFLSREIMDRVIELDLLCVWVTFVDELSTCSEKTVSMVSTVVPENPARRTFKIVRKPADGLAYALSIAEKHHLTYKQIKERLER
jgi:hypothetical protein